MPLLEFKMQQPNPENRNLKKSEKTKPKIKKLKKKN